MVQHATDEASYLISQADRDGDGRVSESCVVGGGGDSVCVCVLYGARGRVSECCVVLFMLVFDNHVRMLGLKCVCVDACDSYDVWDV